MKSSNFSKVTSSNANSSNATFDASNILINGQTLTNTVNQLIADNGDDNALIAGCATLSGNNTFTGSNTMPALTIPSSISASSNAITLTQLPRLSTTITPSDPKDLSTRQYVIDTASSSANSLLSSNNTWTASNTFTGSVIVPTPINTTHATTKTYVDTADNLKANLANPTFTGTVTTANLTATGTVSLPSSSINDTALSSNIARLNGNNTFTNVVKCSAIPAAITDLTTKSYVDTADNLKANLANPTFTGTLTTANLTATGTVTLPSSSINDTALSSNIPRLNVENVFSGLRVNGQAYFNTQPPAIPINPTETSHATSKSYVDSALNLKSNINNASFTGTTSINSLSAINSTFTNPPLMSGASIYSLSIPDTALSTNIPKLNSNSNAFTGGMSIRNATIGSENMAQTNTITGNTNIGSSNTNDIVNYIGKHNFSNSSINAYTFNGLTCNGYSYFNTRPPECPILPDTDNSLTNKSYVDDVVVTSKSQPYLYTWSFGVGRAGASIVNNSLSTAENANRTIYMHIPTTSIALVIPFTVTFNYFFVFANQNQTVPAANSTLSFQTTFYYLYSQLNNTLYKSKEVGSTGTSTNQTFTSNGVNYIYKPLEITAFTGATDKKGVMFKIGLPQMPNTASNGNYIMAFSSSLRIENSYSDDQFGAGRTTNDFLYPSTDSKNEQGSVYFSYVAV